MNKERKIVHVIEKSSGSHHYFGSKKGAFEFLGDEFIGISYNYAAQLKLPIETKKVIMLEGRLISCKQKNKEKK